MVHVLKTGEYWIFRPARFKNDLRLAIPARIGNKPRYKVKAELHSRFEDCMKTRSQRRIPDRQLHKLVQRLLRSNQPEIDTPIIISPREGEYFSSVGRLLERSQGRVSALVDHALECDRAVTVFLPENAYVAEVVNCKAEGKRFSVELVLIQYQDT